MTIINCTPHNVSHYRKDGEVIEYPYTGNVPRVELQKESVECEIVTLKKCTYGELVGLPDQQEDTLLIVSRMVADAAKRSDLIIPIDFVRDARGHILGCKAFEVLN